VRGGGGGNETSGGGLGVSRDRRDRQNSVLRDELAPDE
jgi:hypothetical protein